VLNNITFWHLASLARAAGATDRSALPIAGDDPAAKAAVTEFLDAIVVRHRGRRYGSCRWCRCPGSR
jgi:predicted dinucleotide-binding enzyme